MSDDDFQIFISYSRPDRTQAEEIYDWLINDGFQVWIDSKNIKPGQNWDFEINCTGKIQHHYHPLVK